MIDILVIQIAAGLVIVAAVAAPGLIAWRRREGRSEKTQQIFHWRYMRLV